MDTSFRSDRFLGLLIIVFGLLLGAFSYAIDFNPNQLTLSARFFPLMLAGLLVCLGLMMCLKPSPLTLRASLNKILNPKGLSVGLLLLIYFTTFRYLDFRLGSWLFMLLTMWLLGARKFWELALIPVLVSLFIYMVFRHGFVVLLPVWT
jgi:putative tricarboxylic transport membrane protein